MKKRTFSGTKNPEPGQREIRGRKIAAQAAREGMVLLKNDGILPLKKSEPLALLGGGAGRTIKGGTGSGDVCERHSVSVYEGMKEAGFLITSEDWIRDYEERFKNAREEWKQLILTEAGGARTPAFFDVYTSHAFQFPAGREIAEEDFQGSTLAVYVISRIAGEGADRKYEKGDYLLTDGEIRDLEKMAELNKSVVVLLNIGGLIDLTPVLENPAVKAVLYISQPGMEGGSAAADILSGRENPSGRLTDTWPVSYEDYPNAPTFSHMNGDVTRELYQEGLFTGYRYFDTYEVSVLYSFGYGLSYTQFVTEPVSEPVVTESGLQIRFRVKNIGQTAGKEVVQVYAAAPAGKLYKEYRRLAGWKKTPEILPGESCETVVSVDAKQLASYREADSSWILEAGDYYLFQGSSLEDCVPFCILRLDQDTVLEQAHSICPLKEKLEELTGREERRKERLQELAAACIRLRIQPVHWLPSPVQPAVQEKSAAYLEAELLTEKLSTEELIHMSVGEISRGHDVALGAAGIMVPGAAGETSSILEKTRGVPGVSMADGPAGIRVLSSYMADEASSQIYTLGFIGAIEQGFFADPLENKEGTVTYYQYCTAFPVGTMLAQTWNQELQEEVGRQVGLEMEELGISWWLAPGMNIHRNPLCGRNFEYFSEDPALTGAAAAAITAGVQSVTGCGTTLKHFCCNNQEDNRFGSDSILSERTLREIYLRGFEIAVKASQPMAIMSSYNLINGVHAANSRDLLTTVLRDEWGFKGFVMTDWTATGNGSSAALCIKNGNELLMPGSESDLRELREALEEGSLTMEELRQSVTRLLAVILQTNAFEG